MVDEEINERDDFEPIVNFFKKFKMPKGIEWLDYLVLIQLVAFIIWSIKSHHKYEMVIVYFSAVVFIGWWLMRIVFAPQKKLEEISIGNKN